MPTGYTASVDDGTMVEFRDFALLCARAFGALIEMRDEPLSTALPTEIKPDTSYHDRKIEESRGRLAELTTMTSDDVRDAHETAKSEYRRGKVKYLSERRLRVKRHQSMIEKVEAWAPPTPDHEEMKKFMLQQLNVSKPIGDDRYWATEPGECFEWHKAQIEHAGNDLAYHLKSRDDEIARASGRNEWLQKLVASLPPEHSVAGEVSP